MTLKEFKQHYNYEKHHNKNFSIAFGNEGASLKQLSVLDLISYDAKRAWEVMGYADNDSYTYEEVIKELKEGK